MNPPLLVGQRLLPFAYALIVGVFSLTASQAALSQYTPPSEYDHGRWLIRLMVLDVTHHNIRSEVSGIGGSINIPSSVQPGLDISYFMTDHWALEFQGGIATTDYRIVDTAMGDFDIGSVETASVGLTLQYHFRPDATLRPYAGVGLIHSRTRSVTPADNIPDFDVDDINSLVLNSGVDYQLGSRWFASASLRYLIIPTYHAEGQAVNTTIKLNTLIPGAGVSYRF